MGKPYSMDLRERIVACVEVGHSCRAAARLFGVSASTAVRLAGQQRLRGHVAPKPQGRAPGTAGKLAAHQAFLLEIIRAEPDITQGAGWGFERGTRAVSDKPGLSGAGGQLPSAT
jgi:transposase